VPDDPPTSRAWVAARARRRTVERPVDARRTILVLDVADTTPGGGGARSRRRTARSRSRVAPAAADDARRSRNSRQPRRLRTWWRARAPRQPRSPPVWDPATTSVSVATHSRRRHRLTPGDAVRRAVEPVDTPDAAAVLTGARPRRRGAASPTTSAGRSRAGVVHVLSVSGLHVGMVAATTAAAIA
jgi:hypothetical protein